MKKIIFYTDCFIFGGCEKPVFEILSSREFCSRYDYLMVYRAGKKYKEGMRLFYPTIPEEKTRQVYFLDISTWSVYLEECCRGFVLAQFINKLATVIFYLLSPVIFIYDFLYMYFLFLKENADIVHVNNGGYPGALGCRAAVIAARLSGKRKVILSIHNLAFKKPWVFDRIIDFFVKNSVSIVVTVSKASGLALIDNRGFDKNTIVNIYNGTRYSPITKSKSVSLLNSVNKNAVHIAMVGRFEERKAHKYVVLSFKRLVCEHPEYLSVKLFFMGDGPLLPEIKRLVLKEGLENNIVFLGYRNDCIDYVASSLFLLHPSLEKESLPYSIIESMSVGVPVIGTDVAGIPEAIEDGVTGIIVPPADIDALTQAMQTMLSDNKRRIEMGEASRKRFFEKFSADIMVENYVSLYDRLC